MIMAMLPIFLIGLLLGALLGYSYFNLKKLTPSETKIKVLEAQLASKDTDINSLESLINDLHEKINRLEKEKK